MSTFNSALFNQALFGAGAGSFGQSLIKAGSGLIYPALRKAAVTLGPQRTPSAAQYQDGLEELNRLIGSLNCDRLNIFSTANYQFSLSGAKSYTMGQDPSGATTADLAGPWPIAIERANVILPASSLREPLALPTELQWSQIQLQDIPNSIPYALYNDRAYPLANLYLYPQPVPGSILEMYIWQLVPTFQTIDDGVILPPGYEDALVLNLAVRLAPHFQRQVDPDVRNDAQKALMRIESINAPRPIAELPGLGCCGGYDIYSDT